MKSTFLTLAAAAVLTLTHVVSAQPASTPKLSTGDIQVVPFTREHSQVKFKPNDREMPDELRATTTGQIRITGKKKVQPCQPVRGKPACHVGKLVLLPPGDRTGKLSVKQPSANDLLYHFICVELPGEALDTKEIKLETGVEYTWDVKTSGGSTTFSVRIKSGDLGSVSAPKDKFLGYGLATTVRYKGNEADLTMTFD